MIFNYKSILHIFERFKSHLQSTLFSILKYHSTFDMIF
jgi:hypothetical protein